ncbi:hypothetical protein BT69DRAFT_1277394, partial [Atractiella rhizophila]
KRAEHADELNEDDEAENLSCWDALDQELLTLAKLSHAERFTKASQVYAEDLNLYNSPPESETTKSHRAFHAYFTAILPQILAAGNMVQAGGQGY